MEKLMVVVFDDDAKAREGLRILQELDHACDVSVYEAQVVAKEPGGAVRVIDDADLLRSPMIGGSSVVGALIGLLGGPVGLVVGAAGGALIGSVRHSEELGVNDEFFKDVATALAPGKVALVADIDEESDTLVDTRLKPLGGLMFRRIRTTVQTIQEDRDVAANQAEMDQLNAERAQAKSDRLAKIDTKIDRLRVKLEDAIERRRAKMQLRQQERETKIQVLQIKADQSEGEARRRQEARIAKLRRDYAEKATVG